MSTVYEDAGTCPACGGRVVFDLDCPGWPQRQPDGTTRLMVCMGCGNADRWDCEDCAWWYADPWNRATDEHFSRPAWIDQACRVNGDEQPERASSRRRQAVIRSVVTSQRLAGVEVSEDQVAEIYDAMQGEPLPQIGDENPEEGE